MKKITLIIFLVISMMLSGIVAYAESDIKVQANGKLLSFDVSPYLKDGEVYLPIRQLSEEYGAKVEWDGEKKTAWVNKDMIHVEIPIGKEEVAIHHDADFSGIPQIIKLKIPTTIQKGRTMLPAKIIADFLGVNYSWDNKKGMLFVTQKEQSLPYKEISFDEVSADKDLKAWHDENYQVKGIHYTRINNALYALVCAGQEPTGGYSITIDSVYLSAPYTATVNARVSPPGDNVKVIMMITYPTSVIKIDSDTVKHVEGTVTDANNGSEKDVWVTMDATTVKAMELYSIDQKKIRSVSGPEMETVMKSFNESVIDQNPYIEMIAGNNLKIYLNDGKTINIISYGSKTNVVATFFYSDGNSKTYHLEASQIAQLLLK